MKRQTRLTPAEGGRFADPVGPSPELVAEIRAMSPAEEMGRRLAVLSVPGEPEAPVKVLAWTPKLGDWVRGPDGVVGSVTASMAYYGHKSISIVHVGDRRSTTHRAKRCEPWTPRVGERVRCADGNVRTVERIRSDGVIDLYGWLSYASDLEPAP